MLQYLVGKGQCFLSGVHEDAGFGIQTLHVMHNVSIESLWGLEVLGLKLS